MKTLINNPIPSHANKVVHYHENTNKVIHYHRNAIIK